MAIGDLLPGVTLQWTSIPSGVGGGAGGGGGVLIFIGPLCLETWAKGHPCGSHGLN